MAKAIYLLCGERIENTARARFDVGRRSVERLVSGQVYQLPGRP